MKKLLALLLVLAMIFSIATVFTACKDDHVYQNEDDDDNDDDDKGGNQKDPSDPSEPSDPTDPEPPAPVTPVDIATDGGVVIVGKIGVDDNGWYIRPEQPLNITFEYFLDKPTVYSEQTRVKMFDPKDDGVEKAAYIGQTVTVSGTFRYYRDDFETLYFVPYTITIGKNTATSYGAPGLQPPAEPENRYDPTKPLPEQMASTIQQGKYQYNPYMLSQETLERMGNDFAFFYVDFVDAFLNYETECPCPDKEYAELLSMIIYDEFPLYNACAQPFEYFKHYNAEKGTVTIQYQYDRADFEKIKEKFFTSANTLLAGTHPGQTDLEKAKAIYHALSSSMTYDYSALEEFERKESYYAYLEHSGVCVTFANVYNQLLTRVGIKTTLAYCDYPDDIYGHVWSIVTLDGKNYFCDPTYELSYDNGNGYRFFGITYADRIADGRTGVLGIRYGRYNLQPLDSAMIASTSIK